ncbi:hypothetical protein [Nocardiopsis sp. LOL_012]|uniref:hypothetical protein n=1 Tax=Nocardiopsis sp. LOL_012 TaxID=3345409 RepID=UPI003A8B774F
MSDSPHDTGGYQRPEEPDRGGGYEPPGADPPEVPAEAAEEPSEKRTDGRGPIASERFRRTTPARRRPIPPRRSGGHWRLLFGTVVYVMVVGGMADYTEPGTRALGHLVFWSLIGLALLVAVVREERHGWEPAPRWPWMAAALGGASAVEVLVPLTGSPAVIVGSLILLGLGLFVVMLLE